MSEVILIYGLWDPRDGRLRYIGKTNGKSKNRLTKHVRETKKKGPTNHLRCWLTGVFQDDEMPMMEILEETDEEHWKEVERDWIRQCREAGIDLVNIADGGLGGGARGHVTSEETRQKTRDKWADPEWRARMMESRRNATIGARKSRGGVLWTPEGLASFKEKRKTWKPRQGMKNSPEQNAKIGAANAIALKGRPLSPEAVQAAHVARWTDEERERWSEVTSRRERNEKGQFVPREKE